MRTIRFYGGPLDGETRVLATEFDGSARFLFADYRSRLHEGRTVLYAYEVEGECGTLLGQTISNDNPNEWTRTNAVDVDADDFPEG
jgi:hypothetical protein